MAAVAALVMSTAGCSSDHGGVTAPEAEAPKPGDALHSVGGERGVSTENLTVNWPGVIRISLMDSLSADREVVLVDVRPLHMDDGVELVAVLANPGGTGWLCRSDWPPDGLDPDDPPPGIEGLRIPSPGGTTITFYTRALEEGDYTIEGMEVLYREDGTLYRQEFNTTLVAAYYRDTEAEIQETMDAFEVEVGGRCRQSEDHFLSDCISGVAPTLGGPPVIDGRIRCNIYQTE